MSQSDDQPPATGIAVLTISLLVLAAVVWAFSTTGTGRRDGGQTPPPTASARSQSASLDGAAGAQPTPKS